MNTRKLFFYLMLAFGIFFVVQSPGEAARLVKYTGESAGEWFSTAAHAFSKFLSSLV